ncbi:hypothetical protein PMCN01_0190 [Pasteurella multocida subsp. multocida HB01]|nr:hypothetical protein Pmu_01360 [Pasteurella multocida 36950]AFF23463.1 hypothetical protein PMCN06_0205 [Pasteurella multocida subsp. multocida str. HN06]AFI45360.1 hypothetical protein NT08PM_0201 [Pasteurella multocida subsp. multocida str. 3480]ANJ89437.1 hypothetical protein PMCN01_0190 [Pasteurella multocida subsp. multocida HB01]APW54725.1 hypothetical protein PMCN07_0137 [Pasteurella multocida subsp. multocida str. HN07]
MLPDISAKNEISRENTTIKRKKSAVESFTFSTAPFKQRLIRQSA